MTYELAKKLKDVGFRTLMGFPVSNNKDGMYYPSLSELIEVCGGNFGNLSLKVYNTEGHHQWTAEPAYELSENVAEGAGFTPEEAVARLWLKLKENANNQTEKSVQ